MSVPGGNQQLQKHEVIYVRQGKGYKYCVVILLALIFLMSLIYLPRIYREMHKMNHGDKHHHPHHHKHHNNHHHNGNEHEVMQLVHQMRDQIRDISVRLQRMERLEQEIPRNMDNKVHGLRQQIEIKTNVLLQRIEERVNEIKKSISSIPDNGGSNCNWRKKTNWVDEELERAKREFKQKYRNHIEDHNDL